MPVFSIPLSGLTASSTALSAISNNLANLNTVGYKQSRVTFRDLFYQTIGSTGSGNPIQIGAGSAVGSLDTLFTGGNVETSGVPTDVAISGDGFFVVEKDGQMQYTRAGNFSVSPSGWLSTEDGFQVMGYPVVNGKIDTTGGLSPLQLGKGQINPPNATSYLQMKTNLDAGATVGATFSTPVTVYDSLGASHVLTFKFTKTAGNSWDYEISVPGADVGVSTPPTWSGTKTQSVGDMVIPNPPNGHMYQCTQAGTTSASAPSFPTASGATINDGTAIWTEAGTIPPVIKSGTLSFDGNGKLVAPAADVKGLTITGLADGATTMSFDWNIYDTNGESMLTQMSSASSTAASGSTPATGSNAAAGSTASTYQDGFATGSLLEFSIGADGTIQGSFTNGTKVLGQIALANFANVQGLQRTGRNNFANSLASGQAVVGTPGTSGRGKLSGGALELSNVDIAREFANLIVAQRGFQANARAITTFDEITQETINLKR